VTGATGGVGSMAVQCLAALGYQVTALTGKRDRARIPAIDWCDGGAAAIVVQPSTRPLEKATWAGAVDPVGGETLAWLLRTMAYRGAIAASGLTGGMDVHTSVAPFILRGVKLLGIDSVMCPMDQRLDTWRRLAGDNEAGEPRGVRARNPPGGSSDALRRSSRARREDDSS